jgi:hypothetical protein
MLKNAVKVSHFFRDFVNFSGIFINYSFGSMTIPYFIPLLALEQAQPALPQPQKFAKVGTSLHRS